MNQELFNFSAPKTGKNTHLISFEGIEGAGKTTQIEKLIAHFQEKGRQVHRFREPGATDLGEKLRSAILDSQTQLTPLTEALVFAAARAQLISEKLEPLLKKDNQVIILDRFTDSSLAYQGQARGLGLEAVLALHKNEPLNIFPHLTFYLNIDFETSQQRQQTRGDQKDYFEKEAKVFYLNLISGFDRCAQMWPDRVKTIDATLDPEAVFSQIFQHIKDL